MANSEYLKYKKLFDQGRYQEAVRFAELRHLEGDPKNPFWLTRQAAALSRDQRYNEAFDVAQQALSLNPANPYSILAVADALAGLKRMDEAIIYYEEIVGEKKVSFSARNQMLYCLGAKKEWDKILYLIKQWNIPENMMLKWKSKALEGQNRVDEGIKACKKWLEIEPDIPQGLWILTRLEVERDGLETVLKKMKRLSKIDSRPYVYKQIYASLCKTAGKAKLALKEYEKLSCTGSNINNLRNQAFSLAKTGRETEAIPLMTELLKINPDDFYIHNCYIAACGRMGQLEDALKFYKELFEANPAKNKLYGRIKTVQGRLDANSKSLLKKE